MSKQQKPLAILIGLGIIVILFLMMGPFYTVEEGSQAVVTRTGKIVNVVTDAGLYIKVPLLDVVTLYPKRILSLDGDGQRIPTKENQFIIVDTTSRWRISDPQKFYQSFASINSAYARLADIVDSAVRTVITQNRLSEIVRSSNFIIENVATEVVTTDEETSEIELLEAEFDNQTTVTEAVNKGRRNLSIEMAEIARKTVPEYGIELIDIVPRQIKYSDEITESVFNRMIKDRNQVAQSYRSYGEGKKAEWIGQLERDKSEILSGAYRTSEEIRGNADAQASRIYAQAYSRNPEFYEFWKSLDSYQNALKDTDITFSTDMDYFKYLYSPTGN